MLNTGGADTLTVVELGGPMPASLARLAVAVTSPPVRQICPNGRSQLAVTRYGRWVIGMPWAPPKPGTSTSYDVTVLPPSLTTSTNTSSVTVLGERATSWTDTLGPAGMPYAETGLLGAER